jgi:hypothetical protein
MAAEVSISLSINIFAVATDSDCVEIREYVAAIVAICGLYCNMSVHNASFLNYLRMLSQRMAVCHYPTWGIPPNKLQMHF